MRVLYFGSPEIAVPTLRMLLDAHEVVGIVSQPDRRRGRGRKTSPTPVAEIGLEREIPLFRPEKVSAPEVADALRALEPDIGVVVAFGQFIGKRVRELPRCGYLINGHASLLPKYRGAAPIARAILEGETETGISVMRVEKEMDAGDVAHVRTLAIGADENAGELTERMGVLAAAAIGEALGQLEAGTLTWTEQAHAQATEAPKLERHEAELDWSQPAHRIACRVRAFAPKPGGATTLEGEGLRILAARPGDGACADAPGTVRTGLAPERPLAVATGEGWLDVLRLQRPGGKPLDADAFLRGRPIADGTRLVSTAG